MWSSAYNWCSDCSEWMSIRQWKRYFGSGAAGGGANTSTDKGDASNQNTYTRGSKFGDGHGSQAVADEEDDGWVLRASTSHALVRRSEAVSNYGDQVDMQPFKDISRNKVKRQSVKSRNESLSDSDCSATSSNSGSYRKQYADGAKYDVIRDPEDNEDEKFVRQASPGLQLPAVPVPSTVAITLQPRAVHIHRPDISAQLATDVSDVESLSNARSPNTLPQSWRWEEKNRNRERLLSSQSLSHSYQSLDPKRHSWVGKNMSPHFLTPAEAARPAPSLRRESDSCGTITSRRNRTNRHTNSISVGENDLDKRHSLHSTRSSASELKNVSAVQDNRVALQQLQQEIGLEEEQEDQKSAVVEMNSLKRLMGRVIGGSEAASLKFEYQSPNSKETGVKVHLRSKNTAESITTRKPQQSQAVMQYNFGYVKIVYKFTKEKKLEVDVISVTNLPKYSSSVQDGVKYDAKIPTLNYVDVEVSLRLSKGKQLSHKIKKFRAGDVPTHDDAFEPECTFKSKDLEDSCLVVSVSRRGKGSASPHLCIGHALYAIPREDVLTTGVMMKIFTLKQGAQRQDVKGSVQLVLTCDHPVSKNEVNLTLDVRMVQHVDVSLLGISHSSPDFKINPEIRLRIQLLGSNKAGSKKPSEFPWIALQNRTRLAQSNKEEAPQNTKSGAEGKMFRGWGTQFKDGCCVGRTAYDSELKEFSLCYVVQVFGRNNIASSSKKEVLLGNVVLGPELRSSADVMAANAEDSQLTHWGQAVQKRTAVELLHRLHL